MQQKELDERENKENMKLIFDENINEDAPLRKEEATYR